jgi:hypothetical protein
MLKLPDAELRSLTENGNDTWKRLAIKELGIKSGLLEKY